MSDVEEPIGAPPIDGDQMIPVRRAVLDDVVGLLSAIGPEEPNAKLRADTTEEISSAIAKASS